MIHKIEPNLIQKVKTLNSDESLECVLYAYDYDKLKQLLKVNFDKVDYIPFINAFIVKLKYTNIFSLSKLNIVKYITQSTKVSALINVANKILKTEDKSIIPDGDFSIAVIDTGIFPHLDFMIPNKKIVKFVDFINGRELPYDDNGHGTFVSGVIAGGGIVNSNFIGIDPKTKLVSLKALDKNGETSASTILSAMQWIFDNKEKYNIKVVCMSFGAVALGKNDPLKVGAEMLWDNGIVVVTAAGNSGPEVETIRSPGSSYKVITVGALDDHRQNNQPQYNLFSVADFSSRGPIFDVYKPDMITSGVNINGLSNDIKKGFYTTMSGTSVSTPMVAGIVGIVLKKYPHYTPDQVKKYLIGSCSPITGDRNSEGFGWLDGSKVFRLSKNLLKH